MIEKATQYTQAKKIEIGTENLARLRINLDKLTHSYCAFVKCDECPMRLEKGIVRLDKEESTNCLSVFIYEQNKYYLLTH
jgi:hypothetical protein